MFFLVISFHVGGPEGQFALSLPTGEQKPPGSDASVIAGQATALDLPSELVVNVSQKANDQVKLSIRDAVTIIEAKDRSALIEQLQKKRLEQRGKTGLLIEANSQIKYSRLVEVLDACRCAGFENISFAPPTDG